MRTATIIAALALVSVMPARATEVYECEIEYQNPPLYDKIAINPDDGSVTAISAMTSPPVEGEEPVGGMHHDYHIEAGTLQYTRAPVEDVDKFGVQHPHAVTIINHVGWRTYDGGEAYLWYNPSRSPNQAELHKSKGADYKCILTQSDLWNSTAEH